jgi:glycogen operon protein
MSTPRVWPGSAYPLGATYDGSGTNFALFSEVAEKVELCLFDESGAETRVDLTERDAFVWHGYVPNVGPGQRYGFRVHGPYDPENGHRCNPSKLLLDPYAKAIDGDIDWAQACFSYTWGDEESFNDEDSAPHMSKSVVISPFFDWDNDRHPRTPYSDTVIYEAHVKGLTKTHPAIPEEMRGTYAAVAHPVMIEHYKKHGITAVELMPVHQFVHDSHLADRGQRNYWGYNTIGFFAPHNDYAASDTPGTQVQEFKAMVKALHAEGLEVILDVVYNHTAEGNQLGPTLSFRGIDNANYYRLVDEDKKHYYDTTGTGNTLLMRSPNVLQLIMDSLRYWVTEMHVDGFRFDLASSLARQFHEVDRLSAFFDLVHQDPVVSQTKLIAEPWDIGYDGYNVGGFPPLWTEWNGKYRDTVRDYWRGEPATLAEFASRLTGSADLYEDDGRRPYASINFVTAHDGFTMHDLVSYNEKHNEANGEGGADGESNNSSWNCGVEGETDDLEIIALREQQKRNFLATLFLSQGVPMLLHGDELGRTQHGNNNVYAQDNELAWIDWERAKDFEVLSEFTGRLARLRHNHPVFRRRRHFQGRVVKGTEIQDIGWFTPAGDWMTEDDWDSGFAKSVAVFLNGEGIREPDMRGEPIKDDSFFLLFNGHFEPIEFTLPDLGAGEHWNVAIDTAAPMLADAEARSVKTGEPVEVDARSVLVLQRVF